MIVKHITGSHAVLKAPEGWSPDEAGQCIGLPIRMEEHGGHVYMVSAWEPSPDELKALNAGAPIHLFVCARQHPVVTLEVGELPKPVILM